MLRSADEMLVRPRFFNRFVRSERGTSTVEYATMLGLIGTIAAAGVVVVGSGMNGAFLGVGSSGSASSATSSSGTSMPAVKTVFADSFADPKASAAQWKFDGPWWTLSGGQLHGNATPAWGGTEIAAAENSSFQNGTISFDASMSQGAGFGVFFRLQADAVTGGPLNGYCFQYDAVFGGFVLRKWVNGLEISPPIAMKIAPAGYQWLGVDRQIQVTTVGSQITISVDGVQVLSASDSTYASGSVGLRLWNKPGTSFDNFAITTP
jgi:Flp pilus assembly pilin Flp